MSFVLPSLHVGNSDATARQKIDNEISQLQARIISLKSQRNTHTPIGRVHPEIIQEIFIITSQVSPDDDDALPLLNLTWVCKSWRDLALETADLWDHIISLHPTWIRTFISRAKKRPLHFLFNLPPKLMKDLSRTASICFGSLPRTQTLSIRGHGQMYIFPSQVSLWATPAPILVNLQLRAISLPPNLFSRCFPLLRKLELQGCNFHWASLPIHAGLQELAIIEPTLKASPADVLRNLQPLAPTIKVLQLDETFTGTVSQPDSTLLSPGYAFELLNQLTLTCEPAQTSTFFMNHISFPRLQGANLAIRGGAEQVDTARAFVSSRGMEQWQAKSINITVYEEDIAFELREDATNPNRNANMDEAQEEGQATPGYFRFTFDMFHSDLSHIMPLLHALPLAPIETLTLSAGNYIDWGSHLFDHFNTPTQRAVQVLEVATSFLLTFTPVLHAQNQQMREILGLVGSVKDDNKIEEDLKEQCRNILMFPQLVTLRYQGDSADDSNFTVPYYTVLREWLMWRSAVGLRVKTLVFMDMVVLPKDYLDALFEEVVTDFQCEQVKEIADDSDGHTFDP